MHNLMRRTRPGSLVESWGIPFRNKPRFLVSSVNVSDPGGRAFQLTGQDDPMAGVVKSSRCHRCRHVMPSMSMQSTASRFSSRSLKGLPGAKISLYQQTWKTSNETLVHCWSQLKSASSWRSNQSSRWFRPHAHTHHDCFTGGHDSLQSYLLSSSVKMCLLMMISLC